MFLGYIDPGNGFSIFSSGSLWLAPLLGLLGFFLFWVKKIGGFLKRRKKFVIITLLALLVGIGIARYILMNQTAAPFKHKVIILGFDGLSPDIIERMMKEGDLPNFSRLKTQGSYARLATTTPPESPVAWAGFATGKNPGKHGIYDFIVRDPKTYEIKLSLSDIEKNRAQSVLKEKGFWRYTTEKRIPTVIINCPMTFPPDRVFGRMLSGMGVPDVLGTEGTFTFFTTETVNAGELGGGRVVRINRSPNMIMHLFGPRVVGLGGKSEQAKVPFKVTPQDDQKTIFIEYQSERFELAAGEWSGWHEVVFDTGLFKKMRGVLKFYLVEAAPGFRLYVSPINFDPRDPFFDISYPKDYSRELAGKIGLFHTQGMPIDTWPVNSGKLTDDVFLEQVEDVYREQKAIFDLELNRFEKGVFFYYFGIPDSIQHMFWRFLDKKHPRYQAEAPLRYKTMIDSWYKRMDGVLGEALGRIGKDDTLIVLSDHGFNTFRRGVHLNSWLKNQGYQAFNDLAPDGRELLKDVNWSKTKAYAVGFGAVYINQKGREKNGIVEPGEETRKIKDEITKKLTAWVDTKYNEPVVSRVYRKEDIFWGKDTEEMPDLYVGFNIGYQASWQTALGAAPDSLIEDNLKEWSGTHLFDPALVPGIVFANRAITKKNPSIYDLAPTILAAAGYDEKELSSLNFDGQPLFAR